MKLLRISAEEDVAFYMIMGMESELSDSEKEAIDATLAKAGLPTGGCWASIDDGEPQYGRCEVTGRRGTIVTVVALR